MQAIPTTLSLQRVVLLVLLCALSGCSSMRTVSIQSAMDYSPPPGVEFGRLVEVKPIEGRRVKFRVTEITDEGLGGNAGFYSYSDMETLKVESSQGAQTDTAAIVLGVLGVAALVWLIGNADSVAVCSPSPCPAPNP